MVPYYKFEELYMIDEGGFRLFDDAVNYCVYPNSYGTNSLTVGSINLSELNIFSNFFFVY